MVWTIIPPVPGGLPLHPLHRQVANVVITGNWAEDKVGLLGPVNKNFKFTLVHYPGNKNGLPDFLLREPGLEDITDVQEESRMPSVKGQFAVSQQLPHACLLYTSQAIKVGRQTSL